MFRVQRRELFLSIGDWGLVPTGFNIWRQSLTSKNADRWGSQDPLVRMTKFTLCALLAPIFSCSLLMSWGTVSPSTSLHIVLESSASWSLSSLCRSLSCMTNPPSVEIWRVERRDFLAYTSGGNVVDKPVVFVKFTYTVSSLVPAQILTPCSNLFC